VSEKKKWWLISDEDVQFIRKALRAPTHEDNDFNCPTDIPVMWACDACEGDEMRWKASQLLDSGLHVTDAVPDDFRK